MTLLDAFRILGPQTTNTTVEEREEAARLVLARLQWLAARLLRDEIGDADDAVGLTLYGLVRAPRRRALTTEGGVDAFLITALRRNHLMIARARRRQLRTVDAPVEPTDAISTTANDPEWQLLQSWVHELLSWARHELREAVVPRTYEGFADPELAVMFATSIDALQRIVAGQESLDDAVVRLLDPPPTSTKRGTLRRRMSRAKQDVLQWLDLQAYEVHHRLALDHALSEWSLRFAEVS